MPEYSFQREVRTANSESLFVIDEADRDVGRLEVHYPTGMVHATLIVRDDVPESEIREIANRFMQDVSQLIGVDGAEVAVHVYRGEDRGVFTNDEPDGRRNGNGHSAN